MAFVVTAGQLQSVQRPAQYGYHGPTPGVALQLSATLSMTYEQLWRAQPALRTVVSFLARNVAQLGVDPYQRIGVDRVKLLDHPMARLLERPYPGTTWTKYRLLNTIMHDLCIFDDAYLLKVRNDNGLAAIVPVPPRMMSPTGDNWFSPTGYRLTGRTGWRDIPADEVVHIHGYNPDDPRQGVAPVETLRQILAEEHAASTYREQMWRNGARVAGYIKRPKDAPKWSPDARSNFRNDWQAQYSGDGPETGGTPVLEDGMEFAGSGVTPKDAQYVEARKLTREEVAVAYHVSPVMLGLMDGVNLSSIAELHKMLYQDTLAPYLAQISQDIELQILEDLDPAAKDGSIYVEFNLSEKLRGSFDQQAHALQSAVGGPWMTRSEARAMYNLPHVADADDLIVPLNVIAGGLASPNDTAPDSPDNGPSNGQPPKSTTAIRRALHERQRRVVLSQLGRASRPTLDVFDAGRWNNELTADLIQHGPAAPSTDVAYLAAQINDATARKLAVALCQRDPHAAARQVFDDLIEECQ